MEFDRYAADSQLGGTAPGRAIGGAKSAPANQVTWFIVSRCAFDADAMLLRCRETVKLLEWRRQPHAKKLHRIFAVPAPTPRRARERLAACGCQIPHMEPKKCGRLNP
jgi:hypothetical protein